jgi:hypothetical protein
VTIHDTNNLKNRFVSQNRVPRKIFGLKTGENCTIRKFTICSSDQIITIRMMKSSRKRWARHAACMWERKCANRVLVGKRDGKRPWKTQM